MLKSRNRDNGNPRLIQKQLPPTGHVTGYYSSSGPEWVIYGHRGDEGDHSTLLAFIEIRNGLQGYPASSKRGGWEQFDEIDYDNNKDDKKK